MEESNNIMAYFGQYNDDSMVSNNSETPLANENTDFCDLNNYEEKWKYLREALGLQAYRFPADLTTISPEKCVLLFNSLYRLFEDQKHTQQSLEEYHGQIGTIFDDHKRVVSKLEMVEEELQKTTKEKWTCEMRCRQLQDELSKVTNKLRSQLSQVVKENARIKHRDNQYKHELRKREKQQEKLHYQLEKMIGERTREKPASMEILNTLKAEKRSLWKGGKRGEEELHRQAIAVYEERMNELKNENHVLREAVARFNEKLQDALDRDGHVEVTVGDSEEIMVKVQISQGMADTLQNFNVEKQLQMPYSVVQSHVEDALSVRLEILKEKMAKMKDLNSQQYSGVDARVLRERLKESWDIINKQDELIRSHITSRPSDASSENVPNRRWSGLEDYSPVKSSSSQHHGMVKSQTTNAYIRSDIVRTPKSAKTNSAANLLDFSPPAGGTITIAPETPAGINLDRSYRISDDDDDDDDDDSYSNDSRY